MGPSPRWDRAPVILTVRKHLCLKASREFFRGHNMLRRPKRQVNNSHFCVENELGHGTSSPETGRAPAGHSLRPRSFRPKRSWSSNPDGQLVGMTEFVVEGSAGVQEAFDEASGASSSREAGFRDHLLEVFLRPWRFPVHVQRLHDLAEETASCPCARHPQMSGHSLPSPLRSLLCHECILSFNVEFCFALAGLLRE